MSHNQKAHLDNIFRLEDLLLEVKQRINIKEVVGKLGLNLTQQGNDLVGDCPTGHGSQSHTSFKVPTHLNFFKCFHPGCDAKGDIVSLVMVTKQIRFPQAVIWLANEFGIAHSVRSNGYTHDLSDEERTARAELEIKSKLYECLFQHGHKLLFEQPGTDALKYLVDARKYDPALLHETEFMYLPPKDESRAFLLKQFPDFGDEIRSLSLNGYFGDNFRLAFPYRNRFGQITGLLKRSTDPKGSSIDTHDGKHHDNVRWDSTKGVSKDDLFNLHRSTKDSPLVILEGYPDALYFPAAGMPNVVAIGQGMIGEKHLKGLIQKGVRTVILAFDNDPENSATGERPGLVNTKRTVELFAKESDISVFVVDPAAYGQHKDPDEYVRVNGIESFKKLAESATSAGKWMIDRLLAEYDLQNDMQRSKALEEALDFAVFVRNELDREEIVKKLSDRLGMSKPSVTKALSAKIRSRESFISKKIDQEDISSGKALFPFIESSTSYYSYYNWVTDELHLGVQREILEQILESERQALPEQLPVLKVVFDVHRDQKIDVDAKRFNLFTPSEYMLLRKTSEQIDRSVAFPNIMLLLGNLIPNPDELERYLNWLAGILQTREKQLTAWVFTGKPGAGKNVHLHHVLKPLFGSTQVTQVEDEQLKSQFNGWLKNVILIAFNEIAHDNESRNSIKSRVKAIITDGEISINEKNLKAYTVENFANCLFFSNDKVPLVIEDGDRRFNVVQTGENLTSKPWFADPEVFLSEIRKEVPRFAQFLMNYSYDPLLAKRAITNALKQTMAETAMGRFEEFAMRLKLEDPEWFEDSQTSKAGTFEPRVSIDLRDLNGMIPKDKAFDLFCRIYPNSNTNLANLAKQLKLYGIESHRGSNPITSERMNYFKWR